jgi:hypothetical protein
MTGVSRATGQRYLSAPADAGKGELIPQQQCSGGASRRGRGCQTMAPTQVPWTAVQVLTRNHQRIDGMQGSGKSDVLPALKDCRLAGQRSTPQERF